jgi:hypothetical protein
VNAVALVDPQTVDRLSLEMVTFLETGTPPEGLFAPDVFCDFSLPQWRMQTQGVEEVTDLRRAAHPGLSHVVRWRVNPTDQGFVFEFEERWNQDGEHWYARELLLARVREGSVSELAVYCTGDWDQARQDQHQREVKLLRP